jgi:3',5'-cyclic AMP phosphodiesterase CpdA
LPATDTFREILKEVETIHPAFVLSSGDLVYGNEEPIETYRHEMDEIQGLLKNLDVPFYNAPGNHEIAHRQDFQDEYEKRFGPLWGAFEYGGWRFLALSTDQANADASISAEEMAYVSQTLAKDEPTCVYMHRPVFGRNGNTEEGAIVKQAPELHKLFRTHNVKAVFEGHDHVHNHQTHDGIEYYIAGGAGAPLDAAPQDGGFFHYVIVHVDGEKLSFDVIPAGGLTQTEVDGQTVLGNYSNFDIQANDVQVRVKREPSSVTGASESKKGSTPVEAKLVGISQIGDEWIAHVSVRVAKHKKTTLTFQ